MVTSKLASASELTNATRPVKGTSWSWSWTIDIHIERERERETLSDTMLPDYSANFLFFVVPLLISIDWIVSFVGLLFQSEPQLLYCNL